MLKLTKNIIPIAINLARCCLIALVFLIRFAPRSYCKINCDWYITAFLYRIAVLLLIIISSYSSTYATENNNKNRFIAKKIAIINVNSILEDSVAFQSLKTTVENISKEIQQEELKKRKEFETMESQLLEKKRDNLDEDIFKEELGNFYKHVNIFIENNKKRKQNLAHAHSEAIGQIQNKIYNIAENIKKKYGINIVFFKTQVLLSDSSFDITSEVITELNNQLKHVTLDNKNIH